jgi:hypothetical protein
MFYHDCDGPVGRSLHIHATSDAVSWLSIDHSCLLFMVDVNADELERKTTHLLGHDWNPPPLATTGIRKAA